MKKIFFASLYFIHLLCFNILVLFFLAVLEVSVLSNLKMIRGIYSDNLILILLNIFLCKSRNRKKGFDNFNNNWCNIKNTNIFNIV